MLVLTRKKDDYVNLFMDQVALEELLAQVKATGQPAKIEVSVVTIRGNTTRIGFDAPSQVQIVRGELGVTQGNYQGADVDPRNFPNRH